MKINATHVIRHCVLIGVLLLLVVACSTKKDAFMNRNWHALNTKYNTLYNGSLAFEAGRGNLQSGFEDNFWEVLPIERIERDQRIRLDSEDNTPEFKRAEEKATKAIQRHAMNISDRERNPQTDEAFMLLGKARYFDQRYIPALEAFNYILQNYPDSDEYYQAAVWKQKTLLRLENPELAVRNIKRLLRYQDFNDRDFSDIHAVLAQAFLQMNLPDSAAFHLQWAQSYSPSNLLKGRYLYIIGQLYDQSNRIDSANYAFDQVIRMNRKIPWVYHIHAQLERFANSEPTPENRNDLLEAIEKIEENRENRPYLDKIYREKARFYMALTEDSLGLRYYDRSIAATEGDKELLARNYIDLANYYFDGKQYSVSGVYYDSILMQLDTLDRRYRSFAKKSANLKDIVTYEGIVRRADSALYVNSLDAAGQKAYFSSYIEELKRKQEEAERRELEKRQAALEAFAGQASGKDKGAFYFYNPGALAFGREAFLQNWGDRKLEDNWRWSAVINTGESAAVSSPEVTDVSGAALAQGPDLINPAYYESRLLEPADLDSIREERNFAYYQLGLLYKEKFKDYELAEDRLTRLLQSDPEDRLILPSKYNLFRIYEQTDSIRALTVKDEIIRDHPGTRYAEILLNPDAILQGDTESPDARYNELYKKYERQEFVEVIAACAILLQEYEGDQIAPKFALLKANAEGRLFGFEKYKESLKFVALTYPNVYEGKKSQQMLDVQLPKLASREFDQDTVSKGTRNWKVVFPFKIRDNDRALSLQKRLEETVEDLKYKNEVTKDIYNLEEQFVVVHGFPSREFALGFVELIEKNKDYRIREKNFLISSMNYQIIQVHKNLGEYKEQNKLLN